MRRSTHRILGVALAVPASFAPWLVCAFLWPWMRDLEVAGSASDGLGAFFSCLILAVLLTIGPWVNLFWAVHREED